MAGALGDWVQQVRIHSMRRSPRAGCAAATGSSGAVRQHHAAGFGAGPPRRAAQGGR